MSELVECRNGKIFDISDQRYRLLSNGAVYDNELHHIVGLSIDGYTITKENASELGQKRWEMARKAAETGLMRVNKSNSSLDAWAKIVEYQAKLAVDATAQQRDTTNAAKFVGLSTGFIPSGVDIQQQTQDRTDVLISIPGNIASKLVQLLDKRRHASDNIHYQKHKSGQIVDV